MNDLGFGSPHWTHFAPLPIVAVIEPGNTNVFGMIGMHCQHMSTLGTQIGHVSNSAPNVPVCRGACVEKVRTPRRRSFAVTRRYGGSKRRQEGTTLAAQFPSMRRTRGYTGQLFESSNDQLFCDLTSHRMSEGSSTSTGPRTAVRAVG